MPSKTKKFWIIIVALMIVIGLFIYFFFFTKPEEETPEEEVPEEVKKDKVPPATAIVSPDNKTWFNGDFEVEINDSDIGSGLVNYLPGEKGCQYIIEDLETDNAGGGFRKCDPVKIVVPVGEGKICSSSFSKDDISSGKCKVSTLAFDKAGNNSGWKSKTFNIDLIKPEISEISLSQTNLELNKSYLFEASVSDNSKITGCWFYIDGRRINEVPDISPIPCEKEEQCAVSINYTFEKEGNFEIEFGCTDIAGNFNAGNPIVVNISTNHPPQISSCKVTPAQGKIQTQFQFDVTAQDSEGDEISYLWEFGDGKSSTTKSPIHLYDVTGTFEPKVTASDNKAGKSECFTAWVVVSQ